MSTASTIKSLAAYDLIRDMILSGEALPGTRLVLVDLEKKLGVGRGPIRDALMRLDKSGLVQNIPYKGAIVMMPPSSKEIEHIFNLRIQVECALAKEAMQQVTAEDMDRLEQLAGDLADQTLAVLREGHDGRRGARAFGVRDDNRLAAFHHGDAAIRSTKVNTDNLAHICVLLSR